MKTTSTLVLIVLIGVLGWALPAGAEKALLTDTQLDQISAGTPASPTPCMGAPDVCAKEAAKVSGEGHTWATAVGQADHHSASIGCAGTCKAEGPVVPYMPGNTITQTKALGGSFATSSIGSSK
jgi:hypothetical protein